MLPGPFEIAGSRLVVFRMSSHLPMWEEREGYIEAVRGFLDDVVARAPLSQMKAFKSAGAAAGRSRRT